MTKQLAAYSSRTGITTHFESDLSDEKVCEILATMSGNFPYELRTKFYRLSENQYAWAHKLANDEIARNKINEKVAEKNYSFGSLVEMIQSAQNRGYKRIKVRFDGFTINPGKGDCVYVKNADGCYLGWVNPTRTNITDEEIVDAIGLAAKDPLSAAIQYGQRTGNCACCGRDLKKHASIERGIGPICAEKFGLM